MFIHAVPVEERVRTAVPPKTIEECEVGQRGCRTLVLIFSPFCSNFSPFCSNFAQLGAGEDVLKLGLVKMTLRFVFFFISIPCSVYLQVILMVGLPGSGKTQWALKYAKENPEKRYNVLGAETVLNQMRVSW